MMGAGILLLLAGSGSLVQAQPQLPQPSPRLDFPPPSAFDRTRYLLGPGDQIQISVFNTPELSVERQVLLDGSLTVPLIGTLQVEGKTLNQLDDELTFQLSALLERPLVDVSLVRARPLRIAVVGEVNRPGAYTLTVGAGGVTVGEVGASTASSLQVPVPSVTQILQGAGGITELADIRRVQVRRPQPNGGPPQSFTVNLWDLIQEGDLEQDLLLFDGDSIFVPTALEVTASEAVELASANLAPTQITVNVVGEVRRPGALDLPPNTPLNQAILAAGGLNSRADDLSVELIRLNPNGTVTQREFVLDLSQNLNEETNPTLRNTDVVVVNPSVLAQTADTLNLITSPVSPLLLLLRVFD